MGFLSNAIVGRQQDKPPLFCQVPRQPFQPAPGICSSCIPLLYRPTLGGASDLAVGNARVAIVPPSMATFGKHS